MPQQEKVIKKRIVKYNRRLQKLKDKQAEFGIHTPVHVLTQIEDAEEEIEILQSELVTLDKNWLLEEKSPSIMVIGNDPYWPEDIVAEIAANFGCQTKSYRPLDLASQIENICFGKHRLSVIDLPSPKLFSNTFTQDDWTMIVAKVGEAMPIILLTTQETRRIKIVTRHSLPNPNAVIIDTIDADYYDRQRLMRAFKKALTR